MRFLLSFFILFALACNAPGTDQSEPAEYGNPAAEGFNADSSDAKAIEVADLVMEAMGGRKAWDDTRFITWNFFGRRVHIWDKLENKDRIEILADGTIIEFDTNTLEGTVTRAGEEVTDEEEKATAIQRGYEMWVNDAYWLIMPYKMKDSGVTLKYIGVEESENGFMSHKLQLTFAEVGVTPDNKYHVYVDTTDNLVKYWEYFPEFTMDTPRITTEWSEYQEMNGILLSGSRGQYQLTDINVLTEWPEFE